MSNQRHTTVLLTAAEADTENVLPRLREVGQSLTILHLPLERYQSSADRKRVEEVFDDLERFENIVYGSKRNARFFLEQVKQQDRLQEVRQRLNLAGRADAARYLEENGIPAVYPGTDQSIKLVEFMLRLRRHGHTLYPAGSHTKEEIPGLLNELDIPVTELELFSLEGPEEGEVEAFRAEVEAKGPDVVIFHSRRSVNRTLAAFPELDYSSLQVISASAGVTEKLGEQDIEVTVQSSSDWDGIIEETEKIAREEN